MKESKGAQSAEGKGITLKRLGGNLRTAASQGPKIIDTVMQQPGTPECRVPIELPIFDVTPASLLFAVDAALAPQKLLLRLRNRDIVVRRVRVLAPTLGPFTVALASAASAKEKGPSRPDARVAPGLEVIFEVTFAPLAKCVYEQELTVITEREKFTVPLMARERKVALDFPVAIFFGNDCLVRHLSEKPVLMHNKGEKAARWEVRVRGHFTCNKAAGTLEGGCFDQLIFGFTPPHAGDLSAEGKLICNDEESSFELRGHSVNGNVVLSTGNIYLPDTYLSLESQASVRIFNRTAAKIQFNWKSLISEEEEVRRKELILAQLAEEEREKKLLVIEYVGDGTTDAEEVETQREKSLGVLQRKYTLLRKEVEMDPMIFEDENFRIEPLSGTVWPNSELDINITFNPASAINYHQQVFCSVSCCESRLPLLLEGTAIGPHAALSTTCLTLGEVYVHERQTLTTFIENKGEISVRFELDPEESASEAVQFNIQEGELAVEQRFPLELTFQCNHIGDFCEQFRWRLIGSPDTLVLTVRAQVRPPSFEFDRRALDFGLVAFQFEETREITLRNTSRVAFRFLLRMPPPIDDEPQEFVLSPTEDELQPNEVKRIVVRFTPKRRGIYRSSLTLDLIGTGKDLCSLAVLAEVRIPIVSVQPAILDFGNIYLRYAETPEIELINHSRFCARFVVRPLHPRFEMLGKVIPNLDKGQIPPDQRVKLGITLIAACLDTVELDFFVEIISDEESLHCVHLVGHSVGPTVELSHSEIDFGDVPVLTKSHRSLTITNRSSIEADFVAFTANKDSVFAPVQTRHVLQPSESFEVDVVCVADDNVRFNEVLHLKIKEGMDKEVRLRARGVGHTIFAPDLRSISFGALYTHRSEIIEAFLENKGRRPHTLQWKQKAEAGAKNIFAVFPESVVLPPHSGLMYQFRAFSTEPGAVTEVLTLLTSVGVERKANLLLTTTVEANFARPTLNLSPRSLHFSYIWQRDIAASIMSQEVEVECAGILPVHFETMIDWPFSVSPATVALLPGAKATLRVEFEPSLKTDRVSARIVEKLHLKHLRHPRHEELEVIADFCFPTISIESNKVDFGVVLNHASKKLYLKLRNPGSISANYSWHFLHKGSVEVQELSDAFDILPAHGTIGAGEEESTEFSFSARPFSHFDVVALCRVEGGADCTVQLCAEASDLAYSLSLRRKKNILEFGDMFVGERLVRDFELENTSKVNFDFSLFWDARHAQGAYLNQLISVTPSSSNLSRGEKVKIKIMLVAGFSGILRQTLTLRVAHFEPETITLVGNAYFPSLNFSALLKLDECVYMALDALFLPCSSPSPHQGSVSMDVQLNLQARGLSALYAEAKSNGDADLVQQLFADLSDTEHIEFEKVRIRQEIESRSSKLSGEALMTNDGAPAVEFISSICLGTYIVDLGTIVGGSKASREIIVRSLHASPITFNLNLRNYAALGLSFGPQRSIKISDESGSAQTSLLCTLQTKKTARSGAVVFNVLVEVEQGLLYMLEVRGYVSIPQISLSQTEIDFGRIVIGTVLRWSLLLENTSLAECDWYVSTAAPELKRKTQRKEILPTHFVAVPSSGKLIPGQRKYIEIFFEPTEIKAYQSKIIFCCKDSARQTELLCRGEGMHPILRFIPREINFETTLPGRRLMHPLEIRNEGDFSVDLCARDIDGPWQQEAKLLSELDESAELVAPRGSGDGFWSSLHEKIDMIAHKKNSSSHPNIVEKQASQNYSKEKNLSFTPLNGIPIKSRLNPLHQPLPDKFKGFYVIESAHHDVAQQAANFISKEHSKAFVDLEMIIESFGEIDKNTAGKVNEYISQRKMELTVMSEEASKRKDKRALDVDLTAHYRLPITLLQEILALRLANIDCVRGAVLTNTEGKYSSFIDTVTIMKELFPQAQHCTLLISTEMSPSAAFTALTADELLEIPQSQGHLPDLNTSAAESQNPFDLIPPKLASSLSSDHQRTETLLELQKKVELPETAPTIARLSLLKKWLDNFPEAKHIYFPHNWLRLNYLALDALPEPANPAPESLPLPHPSLFQRVKRPITASKPKTLQCFEVYTYRDQLNQNSESERKVNMDNVDELKSIFYPDQTRWVIPPHSSLHLCIGFYSEKEVEVTESFYLCHTSALFAAVKHEWIVSLRARTALPNINRHTKNLFSNCRKSATHSQHAIFCTSESVLDFGPLLIGYMLKDLSANNSKRHSSIVRLTNDSPLEVNLTICKGSSLAETQGTAFESTANVFYFEKENYIIAPSITLELTVWAMPQTAGVFSETLFLCIDENPDPLCISLVCEGCKPHLTLESPLLSFNRQLVGRSTCQTVTLTNNCRLPVEWKCLNFSSGQAIGICIDPLNGILSSLEHTSVTVTYQPQLAESKQLALEFEGSDVEKRGVKTTAILDIRVESFQVGLDITGFSTSSSMLLDFGKTIVGKSVSRTLTLKNTSAFSITVEVVFKSKQARDSFCALPSRVTISPRGSQTIQLDYAAAEQQEFNGVSKQSMAELRLLEDKTDTVYKEIVFYLKALAQFNEPIIKPSQTFDFGPIIFSSSKTAIFEILNNGFSDLAFELYDANSTTQATEVRKRLEAENDARTKPRGRAAPRNASLNVSQFTISPTSGIIEPESAMKIEVTFKGKDKQTYEARLQLDFIGRDLRQETKNFDIVLRGESCFPFIETRNYNQIFEDHAVQQTTPPVGLSQSISNVFIIEENVFSFGHILPTKYPLGVTERFKLINGGKIPAQVCAEIIRKSNSALAFSISGPKNFVIEPHSFINLRVTFKPDIMNTFDATLLIAVENSPPDAPGSQLTFDLRGQGVLPTLRLEREIEPQFGRLRVNCAKSQSLTLRNNGLVSAKALMSVEPSGAFLLSAFTSIIDPSEICTFEIEFKPPTQSSFSAQLTIMTHDNPFERTVYILNGEGFQDDLSFEGLGRPDDFLDFGERVVDTPSTNEVSKSFFVRNNSSNALRFAFNSNFDSQLLIQPHSGHLAPGMAKRISIALNLTGKYPWSFLNDLIVNITSIKLKEQTVPLRQWDDQKQIKVRVSTEERKWLEEVNKLRQIYTEEKMGNARAKPPAYPPKPPSGTEKTEIVQQPWVEPDYEVLQQPSRELKLRISAQVDIARITLDQQEIFFDKTFLHTSKSHALIIFNESTSKVEFFWEFFDEEAEVNDEGFFTILPMQGFIEGQQKKEFNVHFLPTEVDARLKRQLRFNVQGVSSPLQTILLKGEVERPFCHVDLPVVNEGSERTVEIEAIGCKQKIQKRFGILNTTACKYHFEWVDNEISNTPNSHGLTYLQCLTPQGTILPGKRFEMIFEFDPSKVNNKEGRKFYTFRIIEHPVQQPFIFKCCISEPRVLFTTSRFDFGPLLLQTKATEVIFIKNLDTIPHSFSFSKKSLKGLSNLSNNSLAISPTSAILAPLTELPITLSFTPTMEGEHCYNLCCVFDDKKDPLFFSVKAHGYKLHYEIFHNQKVINTGCRYFFDMGEVLVDESRREHISIANRGAFNLDFSTVFKGISRTKKASYKGKPPLRARSGNKECEDVGEIYHGIGTVTPSCVHEIELSIKPIAQGRLSFLFLISIMCGIIFEIEISCLAKLPHVEFNVKEITLGLIPISTSVIHKTIEVFVKNKESQPLSIHCESTGSEEINVDLIPGQMVLPFCNQEENLLKIIISILFSGPIKLDSQIVFLINSKHHKTLPLKAETVPLSLEVLNSPPIIDFGGLLLRKTISRVVKLRNNSKIPISITFDVNNNLRDLRNIGLSVKPAALSLAPKVIGEIQLTFQPFKREQILEFPILYHIQESNTQAELLKISGKGVIVAAKLSDSSIDFGKIIVKASTSKSIQIINQGDIPLAFEWEALGKNGLFTISPSAGNINPSTVSNFKIEFVPLKPGEFKATARVHVAQLDEPLCILLTGTGINFPSEKSIKMFFEASPHQRVLKTIDIQNPTNESWTIRPNISVIEGENGCFTLPSLIDIPPSATYKLEVLYCPRDNGNKNQENKALLFLPRPDGMALQYELVGRLLSTQPIEKIKLQTTAKVPFMHTLSLKNDTIIAQKLEVASILFPSEKEPLSEGVILSYSKNTQISPSSVSSFPICLQALKAGLFNIQLILTDLNSKNFFYYIIELDVKDALTIKVIYLSSIVREQHKFTIHIANPLKHDVKLVKESVIFDCSCISLLTKDPISIEAGKDTIIEFSYFPLIEYTQESYSLKIISDDLGIFPFTFILDSKASTEIPTIVFSSCLGTEGTNRFRVLNFLSIACQFSLKIEKLEGIGSSPFSLSQTVITVEPSRDAKPREVEIPIKYEPASLDSFRALVSAHSSQGGTFKAYLVGNATPPLPKGPFKIASKGTPIEFKNPYNEVSEFKIRLEGSCFLSQSKNSIKVDPKKSYSINIIYKQLPDQTSTGRLIIEDTKGILWIFFLQGTL